MTGLAKKYAIPIGLGVLVFVSAVFSRKQTSVETEASIPAKVNAPLGEIKLPEVAIPLISPLAPRTIDHSHVRWLLSVQKSVNDLDQQQIRVTQKILDHPISIKGVTPSCKLDHTDFTRGKSTPSLYDEGIRLRCKTARGKIIDRTLYCSSSRSSLTSAHTQLVLKNRRGKRRMIVTLSCDGPDVPTPQAIKAEVYSSLKAETKRTSKSLKKKKKSRRKGIKKRTRSKPRRRA